MSRKNWKRIKQIVQQIIQQNIAWMLPVLTMSMIVLLAISYLVPKKVIDTYKTNITEEDGDNEYLIPLDLESTITYHMNTGSRPIMGIHIGVSKNGNVFQNETITCKVFLDQQQTPVSENVYSLNQGEDVQYVYIPFENYESCIGDISITFNFDSSDQKAQSYPSILANGKEITNAYTQVNGDKIKGNIKNIYIYTHNTYPLVYDLRILVVLFAAASMALNYKGILKEHGRNRNENKVM